MNWALFLAILSICLIVFNVTAWWKAIKLVQRRPELRKYLELGLLDLWAGIAFIYLIVYLFGN